MAKPTYPQVRTPNGRDLGRLRGLLLAIWALALAAPSLTLAQRAAQPAEGRSHTSAGYTTLQQFGGPTSVGAQVKKDEEIRLAPYRFKGLYPYLQPYYDFKTRLEEKIGLAYGIDYNLLYQDATQSTGDDNAAGGVARLYGTWTLTRQESADYGALTFKAENRHSLGSSIAPKQLAEEIGYAGLTAITFSDAGWLLTNLYWHQSFNHNRLAYVAGIVDVTDYVDVYGLVNNWTNFNNLAFSTDPTIPTPNQGLGAAFLANTTGSYYVLAGLADANGDPGAPLQGFDTFFTEHEYFKHIEVGWYADWEDRFTDNIHLTLWQVDTRKAAQVPDGWGLAFSFNRKISEQWLPFVRVGYSNGGGGALLERSLSVGLGYFGQRYGDALGVGFNWGRPSEETFGPGLDDQRTAELYYRFQLSREIAITPSVQLLIDPALNSDEDMVAVYGIRGRITF